MYEYKIDEEYKEIIQGFLNSIPVPHLTGDLQQFFLNNYAHLDDSERTVKMYVTHEILHFNKIASQYSPNSNSPYLLVLHTYGDAMRRYRNVDQEIDKHNQGIEHAEKMRVYQDKTIENNYWLTKYQRILFWPSLLAAMGLGVLNLLNDLFDWY